MAWFSSKYLLMDMCHRHEYHDMIVCDGFIVTDMGLLIRYDGLFFFTVSLDGQMSLTWIPLYDKLWWPHCHPIICWWIGVVDLRLWTWFPNCQSSIYWVYKYHCHGRQYEKFTMRPVSAGEQMPLTGLFWMYWLWLIISHHHRWIKCHWRGCPDKNILR